MWYNQQKQLVSFLLRPGNASQSVRWGSYAMQAKHLAGLQY